MKHECHELGLRHNFVSGLYNYFHSTASWFSMFQLNLTAQSRSTKSIDDNFQCNARREDFFLTLVNLINVLK